MLGRSEGSTLDLDEVDAFASERLAAYKRPRAYEVRDELPHTESGKLLKRLLRDEFWQDVSVPGEKTYMNQTLDYAGRVADYLEFGELADNPERNARSVKRGSPVNRCTHIHRKDRRTTL